MTQAAKTKKALALLLSLLLALSFAPLFSVLLGQADAAVATNRNSSNYVPGHYYYYPAGTTFIKSIHVGYDKDKDKAKDDAINDANPNLLGQDWLDGMGSNIFKKYNYIYIAYGTTTNISEAWGTYIRMKHSSGTPSPYAFTVNGQSVNFDLGSDVDFNKDRGSGSDYIYLYKTNDPAYGLPITEFRSGDGNNDSAKWESYFLTAERDNTGEVSDFNRNAGGHYLWLHYGNYSVYTDVTTQLTALKAAIDEAGTVNEGSCTAESYAAVTSAKAAAQVIWDAYNANRYRCATVTVSEIQNKTSALNAALNSIVTRAYNVKFHGAGNTGGAMTDQRLPVNASRNLNANGFTREFTVNYDYNGATGGNAVVHDVAISSFNAWATVLYGPNVYEDRQSVQGLTTEENGTIDLYANWRDSSVTLPAPTKDGYTFGGWYSDTSLSQNYIAGEAGAPYTPPGNVTLYAKWTETVYNRISYTKGTGYTVQLDPAATAKMSDTLTIRLKLEANKYNCEPVVTVNTGTVTMKPYNAGALIREYEITGITEDYSISIGDAVPPTYTITFVDGLSGEVIEEQTGLPLSAVVYAPDVEDYLEYNENQHLKFTGWDQTFSPANANRTVTSLYEAENHTWNEGTVITPATCQNPGETKYQCAWCTASKTETTAAGAHDFTKQTISADTLKSAATCQSPAVYYYACSICDTVEYNDNHTFTDGEPAAHSYTAEDVKAAALKSAANCTDAAVYYYSCEYCGDVENNDAHTFTSGEANGHNYQWIIDKAANCGETGIKHEKCTVCGDKRNENTVIPTEGEHQFVWVVDTAATCVAQGVQHEMCSICKTTRSEGTVIDPTGVHSLVRTAAVSKTCTEDGNIEYWTCSVCRQKFADANGTTPVTDAEIVTVHEGHDFSAENTASRYLQAAATCTEAAVYYKSCVNCGQKGTETFVYGAPKGHDFYWVTDTPATCAAAGVKHEKCRNCTETRSLNTVIEPTGNHSYTKQTVTADAKKSDATCTAPAVYYYSCATCGKVENNRSHTFTNGSAKGHTFGEWVTDKEASCTEAGIKHRTCTVCDYSETGSIAKTNHSDNDGDYKCDVCSTDMTPAGVCPYCHGTHSGFPGVLVGFIHRILYFFRNLFG